MRLPQLSSASMGVTSSGTLRPLAKYSMTSLYMAHICGMSLMS